MQLQFETRLLIGSRTPLFWRLRPLPSSDVTTLDSTGKVCTRPQSFTRRTARVVQYLSKSMEIYSKHWTVQVYTAIQNIECFRCRLHTARSLTRSMSMGIIPQLLSPLRFDVCGPLTGYWDSTFAVRSLAHSGPLLTAAVVLHQSCTQALFGCSSSSGVLHSPYMVWCIRGAASDHRSQSIWSLTAHWLSYLTAKFGSKQRFGVASFFTVIAADFLWKTKVDNWCLLVLLFCFDIFG